MEFWVGKTGVVTGASSGIGEAIVKVFVKNGINTIGLARRSDRLQKLSESLKNSKGKFYPIQCDLRNESEILKAFEYAEKNLNGVDILVNNAGICFIETITASKTETMRALLDVNVLAAAICAREAVQSIRKRSTQGHIVNINSVLGRHATIASAPIHLYAASKFALHAMTENLRQEIQLNQDKIKITGIYPGLVKTEIADLSVYDKLPCIETQDVADSVIYALSAPRNVQIEEIKITPLHQKL